MSLNEEQYAKHSRQSINKILKALSPKELISQEIPSRPEELGLRDPLFLLSIGKAAAEMTEAISGRWRIPPEKTLTLIPQGSVPPKNYPALTGEHPFPGPLSIESTKIVLEKISSLPTRTALIAAISGGTSSLLAAPVSPITLEKKVQVIGSLMKKGLPIEEINQVRTALSSVKGGKLLDFFHGSESLTIILSDTPGMPSYMVGSGPTIPSDLGNRATASNILKSLDIDCKIPNPSRRVASARNTSLLLHEPIVIGDSRTAILRSSGILEVPNTDIHIWSDKIKGEAQTVGITLASLMLYDRRPSGNNQLFIGSGETTVSIGTSNGEGGRTLELALSIAQTLHDGGLHSFVVGALATDGIDGNSGLAGCIIPGSGFGKLKQFHIQNALRSHNTKPVVQKTGWAIKTGATGTNLNDLFWVFLPENA